MKSNGGENLFEGLMPSHVLTKAEIEVVCQWMEYICHFIKIYQESIGHNLSDAEISRLIEC